MRISELVGAKKNPAFKAAQAFNLDDLETKNNIMRRGNTIVVTDPAAD